MTLAELSSVSLIYVAPATIKAVSRRFPGPLDMTPNKQGGTSSCWWLAGWVKKEEKNKLREQEGWSVLLGRCGAISSPRYDGAGPQKTL